MSNGLRELLSRNWPTIITLIAAVSIGGYRLSKAEDMQDKHHLRLNILERNQAVQDRSVRELVADVATTRNQLGKVADKLGVDRVPDVPVRPSELEKPPE